MLVRLCCWLVGTEAGAEEGGTLLPSLDLFLVLSAGVTLFLRMLAVSVVPVLAALL